MISSSPPNAERSRQQRLGFVFVVALALPFLLASPPVVASPALTAYPPPESAAGDTLAPHTISPLIDRPILLLGDAWYSVLGNQTRMIQVSLIVIAIGIFILTRSIK